MQDGPTDLLPSEVSAIGAMGRPDEDGSDRVRARIQALIAAARELSDTCADLADALRPVPAAELEDPLTMDLVRLRAERTAALLDEAASAARGTLGLLDSACGALEKPAGGAGEGAAVLPPASDETSTWSEAFVELPPRALIDDERDDRESDGHEPDGAEPDGPERDGHEPDGHERDGHEPDGHERDGHEPDGEIMSDTVEPVPDRRAEAAQRAEQPSRLTLPVTVEPRSLSLVPPLLPGSPRPVERIVEAQADPAEPDRAAWDEEVLDAASDPWPQGADPDPVEPAAWTAEAVPGASVAGDGLAVYPLSEPTPAPSEEVIPAEPAHALPIDALPVDDPGAAVLSRQVEAARRHLQAALVVANDHASPRLGTLLTAVERVLTAVTDLARETRGMLEPGLADRTFPGEARFLCSTPWERVALVGPDPYADEGATPAGLARLLRALGYEAHSVTSASGVAGVQVRSERYAAHVALVEPAGGGRQRWSGALEWVDGSGASRTWAETLGPVEVEEDELARRVDELLRRCAGPLG